MSEPLYPAPSYRMTRVAALLSNPESRSAGVAWVCNNMGSCTAEEAEWLSAACRGTSDASEGGFSEQLESVARWLDTWAEVNRKVRT